MTTPDQDPVQGQRRLADRYRLDELLGRGATGTVWAAYDEVLRRRVAVKEVPPPPGMPAPEADLLRERTLREARAIAVLSHPNVVTLYDVVQQGGEPFVVMELLPARSLATVIREHGPLDIGGAAIIGITVAGALAAAHRAGITHRDVKPGNVLIGEDGRIKLTDFGISRNVAESRLTITGMTLGSPAFIAPEVASGGQVTSAADLWGLGATLFAAVQGHPPYDAGDALATVAAVVNGEVPLPTVGGPLATVISGLMVKDPSQRLPLDQVRQLLRPLLPADGKVLRDDSATVVLAAGPPAGSPTTGSSGSSSSSPPAGPRYLPPLTAEPGPLPFAQPLAAEPGPLPFAQPSMLPAPRRSGLVSALLALACALLFAAGAGGGFVLARVAGGLPLVPDLTARSAAPPAQPAQPGLPGRPQLVDQLVIFDQSDPNARFALQVPSGWTPYRADLNTERPGVVAIFVSADGARAISVERFVGFAGTVVDYRSGLVAELAEAFTDHNVLDFSPTGELLPGASEQPYEGTYRTVRASTDGSTPAEVRRSTFVQLLPTATELWVLKVTVPTEQEKAGRELFEQMRPTFTLAGS